MSLIVYKLQKTEKKNGFFSEKVLNRGVGSGCEKPTVNTSPGNSAVCTEVSITTYPLCKCVSHINIQY